MPHKFDLPTRVQEFYPSVPGDLIPVTWIFNSFRVQTSRCVGLCSNTKANCYLRAGSGSQVETITELTYFEPEAFLRVRRNV